ncbi:MAG: HAD family hydrolase [Candidatus Latescibacterota bacterium]|nr:HAD family hydrolase [Candidatus Latescibacterota bacterium]
MIDLVAFDMDGTVLDSESRLSASAVRAIAGLIVRGVPAASVSGRSIRRSQEPFFGDPELARALYVGGYNGAVVVGPDAGAGREILHEERLDETVFVKLAEYGRAEGLNLIYCLCEKTDSGIIEEYRHVDPVDHLEVLGGPGFALDGDLYGRCLGGELGPPPKIMLVVDPERRAELIADIGTICGDQVYTSWAIPDRVEVMHRGVDKGVAIRVLAEQVGGVLDGVLAIGDADNDLPMLRAAGVGVLMGNAKQEVKNAVSGQGIRIGPMFAQDGFAQVVKEYVLDH